MGYGTKNLGLGQELIGLPNDSCSAHVWHFDLMDGQQPSIASRWL
jgi:hypothetical protein